MSKGRRLFFALWPDDDVRHHLNDIAMQYRPEKSRAIAASNLHATLIFLGLQPQSLLPDMLAAAATVKHQSFILTLQQVQVWRRPQVLCLCPDQVPEALITTHDQLRQALSEVNIQTENRKYRPHVTLARKVKQAVEVKRLPSPLEWPVKGFSLVESVSTAQGAQYHPLNNWPTVD